MNQVIIEATRRSDGRTTHFVGLIGVAGEILAFFGTAHARYAYALERLLTAAQFPAGPSDPDISPLRVTPAGTMIAVGRGEGPSGHPLVEIRAFTPKLVLLARVVVPAGPSADVVLAAFRRAEIDVERKSNRAARSTDGSLPGDAMKRTSPDRRTSWQVRWSEQRDGRRQQWCRTFPNERDARRFARTKTAATVRPLVRRHGSRGLKPTAGDSAT